MLHTDLVNLVRGRGLPDYDPAATKGPAVGWVPADLALDAFGGLVDNPWGPTGELRLVPDPETFVEIDPLPGERPRYRFALARCVDLDDAPWPSCPRVVLERTIERLHGDFELHVLAATEHEFALLDRQAGLPFTVDAARRAEPLLTTMVRALAEAGVGPENVLPEFGRNQFEITAEPAMGVAAADRTVIVREVVREVARALDTDVTFSPIIGPGVGSNGAHLHLSLLDCDGHSVTADPRGRHGLSPLTSSFAAGIMAHLPGLTALCAPSVVSYQRIGPRSWSAGYTAFGVANREAALRLAPGRPSGSGRPGLGPSLEFRPIDATANPYLALAGVLAAGMDGIRRHLPLPHSIAVDPDQLDPDQRAELGIEPLPHSLDDALVALEHDDVLTDLFDDELWACWISLKRQEIARFRTASPSEIIAAYADAY
ncbi:MAG: glutamine synthetase family protein [Actinomycetota bacterium]